MQLYVLDRAKNTLATTASFYNDKHHKELTAGASTFEFTVDKTDDAAQYMSSGNYIVYQDDRGRVWSFTILDYDETQTTKTVFAEDVSIELLNKAMDVWNTSQAYPFSYYFDLVTKDTPWKLGVNQLTDLSRKLVYTGRDTGLGRLLSVLKGFDNAECQFNVTVQQNKPVTFTVDVYKSIGTVQDNIQIVYNNELDDIKKTESRAQFVTALAGVGGLVENQATTDPGLEKHIDFTDIDYKDDNFVSPKGDKFLRAVTANKTFNPGATSYIEDFYDYDTQSAQELLNRTLTQLKERSEPQYTYEADVKIIDPTLDIGDTVTIIDHDYNPALYLQARVATLDKSYTDPTQGSITFCNYRVLNSTLSDQLRAMQNIIDKMPTSSSVKLINSNIVTLITQNEDLKKQVVLALKSADGKSTIYFDAKPSTAQDGDVAFVKNADGATEIWKFVEGAWKLDTGLATFEDVKKAASAAADAGSQAVIAGQQASAAGVTAKSAGDFAASAASQSTIETAAAQSAANSAVDQANLAVSQAGFANDAADQAKTAAASAQADAANALGQASTAITNASTAINAATDAQTKTNSLVTKVDDIAGTIKTLATTETVDQLAGTVATTQSLAQFAADGLKLKADTTTVDQINGTVNDLKGELDVQADKIAATVTASDVTGMLGNYATQSWSQGQISAAKNEISASVETVKNTVDNMAIGGRNYILNSDKTLTVNGDTDHYKVLYFDLTPGTWTFTSNAKYTRGTDTAIAVKVYNAGHTTQISTTSPNIVNGRIETTFNVTSDAAKELLIYASHGEYVDTLGNTIEIDHYKLEKGNKSTDWSPAPEDMATTEWTQGKLDLTADGLTSQISSVKNDLTNLAIGGRNYFSVSGFAANKYAFAGIDCYDLQLLPNTKYTVSTTNVGIPAQGYANVFVGNKGFTPDSGGNGVIVNKPRTVTTDSTGILTIAARNYSLADSKDKIQVELGAVATSWSPAPEDQATVTQFTELQQTLSGVQVTANNAVTQGQLTLLSDQFTSTISGVKADGQNLIVRTGEQKGYMVGTDGAISGFASATLTPAIISISAGDKLTMTICKPGGDNTFRYAFYNVSGVTIIRDYYAGTSSKTVTAPAGSATFRISYPDEAQVKLERGAKSTPWTLAAEDASSQITQLQSDINLRVKTGDLINQINISTEGILIDGRKVHITGDTTIDSGVIKTAMIADAAITNGKIANAAIDNAKIANASITAAKIADLAVGSAQIADGAISTAKIGTAAITSVQIADASILDAKIASLSASKLTAGTIDASKINVINISAANIDAGSLSSLSSNTGDLYLTGTLSAGPYYITDNQSNSNVVTFWNWKDGQWYTSGEWFDASGNSLMDNSVTINPVTGILFSTSGFKGATGGSFKIGGGLDSRATLKNTTMYLTNNSSISVDSTSRIIFGGTTGSDGVYFDQYGNVHANVSSWAWKVKNINNADVLVAATDGKTMNVTAKAFVSTSKLSTKMDITPLTPDDAVAKLLNTDIYAYRYIDTGSQGQIFYSPVIDDLHREAQYRVDDDFVTDDHESRIDGNMVGALVESVKYFKARIDNQEGLIKNLQQQIINLKSA